MSETRGQIVVTGAAALVCAPRAPITPERWAGAPAKLARMDRLCALALVACDGALVDGQLWGSAAPQAWDGERTAVVLGTAFGCHATNEDYYRGLVANGPGGASPRLFAYTLPSSPVGEISIHYGIRGPASAIAPGLTAGAAAIGAAVRELSSGRADRVLVAAAEVATPLLERLLGRAPLADGAAALVLERAGADASGANASGAGANASEHAGAAAVRGRVLATAEAYRPGARAVAVAVAAERALAAAGVAPGAVRRLLAAPGDAEAVRPLGVSAPSREEAPETLGAAPLIAAARTLQTRGAGLTLLVAGDPEGAGAAVLLES